MTLECGTSVLHFNMAGVMEYCWKMKRFCLTTLFLLFFLGGVCAEEKADPLREKAQQGDVEAQLKLGDEFFFGRNRPRNPTVAAYWFRQAAEQGSAAGLYNLGVCQEQGWGIGRSRASAYLSFEKAAQAGLPAARMRRAILLFRGVAPEKTDSGEPPGVTASPVKAAELLRELIREGFAPARFELANLFFSEAGLRREHANEIRELLEKACEPAEADPAALLLLSDCYRDGIGGLIDLKCSADCLERAVGQGSPEGMARYAELLDYGLGRPIDRQRAFELSKQAAEAGSPRGQLRLGDYYLQGEFITHDPVAAVECFRKAAEQGYPPAFLKLGNAYSEGIGVEKDLERAFEEYGKAARAGDAAAQYRFGRCYLDGTGVAADPAGAVFWFRNAVGRGNLDAMRELGLCLLTGRGVKVNRPEGARLLQAAAAAGDAEARELLSRQ